MHGVTSNESARCGAKTRSGEPCKLPPVTGRTRCRMHGGATPIGTSSPHFKDGRYSRLLPARLQGIYQEMLADPRPLSLVDEIAIVDARLAELTARVATGESGAAWHRLVQLLGTGERAMAEGDDDAASAALEDLLSVVEGGMGDAPTWAEITRWVELRRRLVASESARVNADGLSVHQTMAVLAGLVDIVARNVPDRAARAGIADDLHRLLARGE